MKKQKTPLRIRPGKRKPRISKSLRLTLLATLSFGLILAGSCGFLFDGSVEHATVLRLGFFGGIIGASLRDFLSLLQIAKRHRESERWDRIIAKREEIKRETLSGL